MPADLDGGREAMKRRILMLTGLALMTFGSAAMSGPALASPLPNPPTCTPGYYNSNGSPNGVTGNKTCPPTVCDPITGICAAA
jgi:hypothetical protein